MQTSRLLPHGVALLFLLSIVVGATVGNAPGFAADTTGGGDVTPDYPKTVEELKTFLKDEQPRVVILDKEYDFLGQDVILFPGDTTLTKTGGCDQQVKVEVTYDNASKDALVVGSNKTLRGVGQKGVLKGKGLWLDGDNIIIQNVHVTELNPQFVWGGDAIYLQGTEGRAMKNIWIDHVKISRIGRQMFTSGFAGVESLTISNSDFDGRTDWSSSCDGRHYWGFILDGTTTRVSFLNNYIHSTSGRSPKIIGASSESANVVAHVANNYWADNSGHSFEPGTNAFVLAEGNYFEDTPEPMLADAEKASISTMDDCSSSLGRSCPANTFEKSGKFDSVNGERSLETLKQYKEITDYKPVKAAQLSESSDNFGVGTLGGSTSSDINQASASQSSSSASESNLTTSPPVPGSTEGSSNTTQVDPTVPIQNDVKGDPSGSVGTEMPNSAVVPEHVKCTPKRTIQVPRL